MLLYNNIELNNNMIYKINEFKITDEDLLNYGVYKITCNENKEFYIGSTTITFISRWRNHRADLLKDSHYSKYMQNSFNKYGQESFTFQILEICNSKEETWEKEQEYINELQPKFNSCPLVNSFQGIKLLPREEQHTLNQVQAARKTLKDNNKTGHTGIYYCKKDKDYRASIQFCSVRISLGSFKTLEEAVTKRKEAEEYFWQPFLEHLPIHIKKEIVNQYKGACKFIRSNSNIEGVTYAENKGYSVFITTKDGVAINLTNYLSLEEAIKLRKEAEQYFYSEEFICLSPQQKQEAIKHYKDKIKTSKITSGHQYIIWDKNSSKWIVKPKIDNKLIHLGSYKDLDKAIEVKQAALQYFNSNEFLSNDLDTRLKLAQQYKITCHEQNNLDRATGVCFHKATQSWRAYIYINGKNISLGQYPTKEMALQARKEGELKYRSK